MKHLILIPVTVFFLYGCSVQSSKMKAPTTWTETIGKISAEEKVTNTTNFQIIQTDLKTSLVFNGKAVKEWSHVSSKNPFVWDEWCDRFTHLLNSLPTENWWLSAEKKQKAWESLSQNEQELCIKENLANAIKWTDIGENFYEIKRFFYEWSEGWLFDTENKILLDWFWNGKIKKIYSNLRFVWFVIEQPYWDTWDTITIYSRKLGKVIKNWNIDWTEQISVINIEFTNSWDANITFKKGWPYNIKHDEEKVLVHLN